MKTLEEYPREILIKYMKECCNVDMTKLELIHLMDTANKNFAEIKRIRELQDLALKTDDSILFNGYLLEIDMVYKNIEYIYKQFNELMEG